MWYSRDFILKERSLLKIREFADVAVVLDRNVLDTVGIEDQAALAAARQEQLEKNAAKDTYKQDHRGAYAFGGKRVYRLPAYVDKIEEKACEGGVDLWIYAPWWEKIRGLSALLQAKRAVLLTDEAMLPFMHNSGYDKVFRDDGLDFEAYDSNYNRVYDKEQKLFVALSRLLYPCRLSEKAQKTYEEEIKKRYRPALKLLLSGNFDRYGLPSPHAKRLLELKPMDRFLKAELVELAADHHLPHYTALLLGAKEGGRSCPTDREPLHHSLHLLFDHKRFANTSDIQPDKGFGDIAPGQSDKRYGDIAPGQPDKSYEDFAPDQSIQGYGDFDLAADIACEYLVDQCMGHESCKSEEEETRGEQKSALTEADIYARDLVFALILRRSGRLLFQEAYDWIKGLSDPEKKAISRLFFRDRHDWIHRRYAKENSDASDRETLLPGQSPDREHQQFKEKALAFLQDGSGKGTGTGGLLSFLQNRSEAKEEEANLQKRQGYDYQTFLKQFMTLREDRVLDLDSFDPVYYTLGLSRYQDMPLIEPLETKEMMRLEELVIVIDTSGSCSGKLVRFFLEETWSVFGNQENFFDHFQVRILQCDHIVQEDVCIEKLSDVDSYMENLKIRGGGSTDFRAAFTYVAKLREKGELKNLKGILYFTDGFGTFPKYAPQGRCAFIFLENRFAQVDVPLWADKLLLPFPENADWEREYTGAFTMNI